MKQFLICLLSFFLVLSCNKKDSNTSFKQIQVKYPVTKKNQTKDTYFGTSVEDPYRWLEDDNSKETAEWVKAQNKITFDYLNQIPFRDSVITRLSKLWDYERMAPPVDEGTFYLYEKNNGLQNQNVLYIKMIDSDKEEVLIDPNTLSKGGTVALSGYVASGDNKYLAYMISKAGSDWNEIYVMDLENRKLLKDKIEWVKFSGISWEKDGFYYSRYDKPSSSEFSGKNEFHQIYYHKVGQEQSEDNLIFKDSEHPLRNYYAFTTEDERFLVISGSEGTSGNNLLAKELSNPSSKIVTLVDDFKNDHVVIGNNEDKLIINTNLKADNHRIVLADLKKATPFYWQDLIAEKENMLENASQAGGKLFLNYLVNASDKVYQFGLNGTLEHEIKFPFAGTTSGFSGKRTSKTLYYSFTSFTSPSIIYKYNIASGTSTVHFEPKIDFHASDYEVKQEFYQSKDGTKVPMFIVHKKGINLDGSNPTLLYGYGGFDISLTPAFSPARLIWLEKGGVFAQPSLRGGGEFGKKWHESGMLQNKQNVFDDFIAAAEYLVNKKYTSPGKLAVEGRSNGGLLVGAVMTQRPELFKVALPGVGVLDMLRYHRFTIGWAWAVEYGSSEDSVNFNNLYRYSPLHNIKQGVEYPATFVTTADHDDRVVPAHSFKFISTLQEKYKGTNPVLIRIDVQAGHGSGKPTSKLIEEWADKYAFTWYNIGVNPF